MSSGWCLAIKQAETGKQCVCVVYVLPTHTFLSCCFILSVLYWAEHSIPMQFRLFWAFFVQENGDSCIWKGGLQRRNGALCIKGAKSETWISGICLCLNHSCLYQLTHSVKFMCSLLPFPLLSCRWSISGWTQILPVRESAERELWTKLSCILSSGSAINKISWQEGVGEKHFLLAMSVAFLKRAAEEMQRRKSSTSLEILIFFETKCNQFCLPYMGFRKSPEISNKTHAVFLDMCTPQHRTVEDTIHKCTCSCHPLSTSHFPVQT